MAGALPELAARVAKRMGLESVAAADAIDLGDAELLEPRSAVGGQWQRLLLYPGGLFALILSLVLARPRPGAPR